MTFPICNRIPTRAPHIFGHTFPLCWRCTGVVVGSIIGLIMRMYINPIGYSINILVLPLAIDGVLQYKFGIESTNPRRFITGIVCGLTTLY